MSQRSSKMRGRCVQDVVTAMESIAPPRLAQAWDNVGLLAGDRFAKVRRVLCCIDLTTAVVKEAVRRRCALVLAYHPPIFKPIRSLTVPGHGQEGMVFDCVARGIAIYSPHTALDAAQGGTNDALAELCGLRETEPLEYVLGDEDGACKVVVFVPRADVEHVAAAMFEGGAGRIGNYTQCSYRSEGQGTFFGADGANPAVGAKGRLETVEEVRLEAIATMSTLPAVVAAIRAAHPYEEPAFDIYPLRAEPVRGIGRVGAFARPIRLGTLAGRLKRATGAANVQLVGARNAQVNRAVIVVGAAGDLAFRAGLGPRDVVVTGEIRHHDGLAIGRRGACAIALGHWASERPVLTPLAAKLSALLDGVTVEVSQADADPFARG